MFPPPARGVFPLGHRGIVALPCKINRNLRRNLSSSPFRSLGSSFANPLLSSLLRGIPLKAVAHNWEGKGVGGGVESGWFGHRFSLGFLPRWFRAGHRPRRQFARQKKNPNRAPPKTGVEKGKKELARVKRCLFFVSGDSTVHRYHTLQGFFVFFLLSFLNDNQLYRISSVTSASELPG